MLANEPIEIAASYLNMASRSAKRIVGLLLRLLYGLTVQRAVSVRRRSRIGRQCWHFRQILTPLRTFVGCVARSKWMSQWSQLQSTPIA